MKTPGAAELTRNTTTARKKDGPEGEAWQLQKTAAPIIPTGAHDLTASIREGQETRSPGLRNYAGGFHHEAREGGAHARAPSFASLSATMRHLDLFSGIGGFALAARMVWGDEHEVVSFCEIDPFCHKVLRKHWPNVPIHHDIKTLDGSQFSDVDILTGGFPCQDLSSAGRQAGITGERSGLWSEMWRLIRDVRPRWVVVENVPNLLAGKRGAWFGRLLGDLAAIGYDAEWHVLPASWVGAVHRRARVWVVAYPTGIRGHYTSSISRAINPRPERAWRANALDWVTQDSRGDDRANSRDHRIRYGVPAQLDRLKSLGNAIVPQVAAEIFHAIQRVEAMTCDT